MLLRFLLTLCVLLFPGWILAEAPCVPAPVGERRDVLTRVQSQYSELQSLAGKFEQTSYLAALDVSEHSRGDVWFSKPGQMRWEYRDPEHQVFITSGETFWYYQESEKQLLIDQFRGVLTSELPLAFLSGVGNLGRDFTLKQACVDGELLALELSPRAESENLAQFTLYVSRGRLLPMGAEVQDGQENVTKVMFLDVQTNQPVSAKLFTPDFPPGTDVQDRRGLGSAGLPVDIAASGLSEE